MMAGHIPSNKDPSWNEKVIDDGYSGFERWETAMGVAPRLSAFFSSPEARTVLREFKSCANTEGDAEVLAFLLICLCVARNKWKDQTAITPDAQTTARSLEAVQPTPRDTRRHWLVRSA